MHADIIYLILAIALLWAPRSWLRLGFTFNKRRRRSSVERTTSAPWEEREPGDPRINMRQEFSKFRNYVDFLRAGAASVALAGSLGLPPVLWAGDGATRREAWIVIGIRTGLLVIGLLVQTLRYENGRITYFPAIFYLAGLSFGLVDLTAALCAFVLIWAVHVMFSGPLTFLATYALFLMGFGDLFARGNDLSAMLAGILCLLPVMLSLLTNRPLIAFSRRGSRSERAS